MDRIERTLELLAEHQVKFEQNQEEFQRDLKQLLTAQVIQGNQLSELRRRSKRMRAGSGNTTEKWLNCARTGKISTPVLPLSAN